MYVCELSSKIFYSISFYFANVLVDMSEKVWIHTVQRFSDFPLNVLPFIPRSVIPFQNFSDDSHQSYILMNLLLVWSIADAKSQASIFSINMENSGISNAFSNRAFKAVKSSSSKQSLKEYFSIFDIFSGEKDINLYSIVGGVFSIVAFDSDCGHLAR